MVHALHAIPGRDRAGPPRVPPQFPDDGAGPDGDGGGGGLAARRAHGGRRGDDAAAPRAAEASWRQGAQHVPRLGAHVAADSRRPRLARGAARPDDQGRRSRGHPVRRVGVRPARAVPGRVRIRRAAGGADRPRARCRGPRRGRDGSPCADAPHAARRIRRRRRRRQLAAVRRAARLRRAARGVLRDTRVVRPAGAGPHHRRVGGLERTHGLPDGASDARAAHPPREGDVEHLHGAGAARQHGGDVRRLSRAEGAQGHRVTRALAHGDAGVDPDGARLSSAERRLLRHAARRLQRGPGRRAPDDRRGRARLGAELPLRGRPHRDDLTR